MILIYFSCTIFFGPSKDSLRKTNPFRNPKKIDCKILRNRGYGSKGRAHKPFQCTVSELILTHLFTFLLLKDCVNHYQPQEIGYYS